MRSDDEVSLLTLFREAGSDVGVAFRSPSGSGYGSVVSLPLDGSRGMAARCPPVPRDSGRISGNLHRPRRFNRRLLCTCYLAALSSLKNGPASRAFYDRKRAEGKSHKQALIALARRRPPPGLNDGTSPTTTTLSVVRSGMERLTERAGRPDDCMPIFDMIVR